MRRGAFEPAESAGVGLTLHGTCRKGTESAADSDGLSRNGALLTGAGLELGAGLVWSDPSHGLTSDLRLYSLAAHEDSGYEECGVGGSLRIEPPPSGRDLSLSMTPSWGTESRDGRLWSTRPSGLAGAGNEQPGARLDAELGYGLPLAGTWTGTPCVGFGSGDARDYRLGWRLTSGRWQPFSLELQATRLEHADRNEDPRHEIGVTAALEW